MRENKYDDDEFFEKYSQMSRSVLGLAGAGEWTELEKMLCVARERNAHPAVSYVRCAMEDLDFKKGSFDIVLSSLAFHYIKDFGGLVRKIYSWLATGGTFVFSVEHPVFTAYGSQDWYYDAQGNILHFPGDNYYYEGVRDAVFLGEHVTKYHRTLTTYINTLLECGFTIQKVVEPMPPAQMMDMPGMKDEMRRPMMLLLNAKKQGGDLKINDQ